MIKQGAAAQLALADRGWPEGSYVLWSQWASRFPQDKTLGEIKSLLDFVKASRVLVGFVEKNKSLLNELPRVQVGECDYALPLQPVCFRDFYCFEEHVQTARKGRGLEMIPEWYEAPIFYYSNHLSFRGPFEDIEYPRSCTELDLELEIACIVGRELRNASLEEAREAIFGYCLLNDWTARDFQRFEMKVNMGPTKGKDFATSMGSYVISADELEPLRSQKGFDVEVEARINSEVLTTNNWKKIHFSFEEMLVRASKNCTVYPGEVIASGTIGGGCLMENRLTGGGKPWLKSGDLVELRWKAGPYMKNRVVGGI